MRRRRFKRLPLRKALFVLPNLFTLSAMFAGFYSMILASQASRPWDFWAAAWLVTLAAFLDGIDGRVARLTHTQSRFGLELDSLSDLLAFGMAPAWLLYHWGLQGLGLAGVLLGFTYVAAVAVRLARFNMLAKDEGDARFFVGLSSPVAAILVAGTVAVRSQTGTFGAPFAVQPLVAGFGVGLSLLMVSNIRFRSFKDLNLCRRRHLLGVLMFLAAFAYLSATISVEMAGTSLLAAYVAFHLAAVAVRLERRLLGKTTSSDDDDDIVLVLDEVEEGDEDEETIVI